MTEHPGLYAIDYCTESHIHTTTAVSENDYTRCGDCGGVLRGDDPRLATDDEHEVANYTTRHRPDGSVAHCIECTCGVISMADNHDGARAARQRHLALVGPPPAPADRFYREPHPDIHDATTPPGVTQLPAVTTSMTPAQFKEWLAADGTLFMVILPTNRTFVIKVPAPQHEFFVAMMQQIRFALGPEVQAVRMNVVTGDPAATDGTATEAPDWAKPDNIARPSGEQEQPPCGHPNHGNPDHECTPFQPPTRHEYRDDIRHTVQHDIAGYAHVDIDGPQLHSVTCTCGHTATGDTRHDAYRSHNRHALHPEA
ncbi:hypothetical protein SEA_GANCHO_81 [Mycobacterium phage Gancho]|uniref:Uncharacterized protein n=1 Tax=Mycobacterium phage Gancho TaxID=2301613 RepID=A0A385UCF3_9CAUD|nr:hypothetical protein SEA_GANCHO_81 [Mycobacterium phage Gancho]